MKLIKRAFTFSLALLMLLGSFAFAEEGYSGTITISLRINKRGQIDSMALIRRSGASISQQSFTFKAIRKASLPPMPQEVQADVIGELMELIFEFNFD